MHYYFIVNPVAGAGRAIRDFDIARETLDKLGVSYSHVLTKEKNDAILLAREALEAGHKRIVAVGGDGTFNEVASAAVGTTAAVGLLPFGTGNDISKILGIKTEPAAAINTLLTAPLHRMDVGRLNERYFFNVSGMGFDVDVLVNTEQYKTRYKGIVPYLLGIIRSITKKKALPLRVLLDGNAVELAPQLLFSVANGTHFGGGMKVAPDADPFDGLFDIISVKNVSILHFITMLPGFIGGKHIKYKQVTTYRAKRVEVTCDDIYPIQIDGEICEFLPACFEVLPGALNVVSPPSKMNKNREVCDK